jgi:hypothetical protein
MISARTRSGDKGGIIMKIVSAIFLCVFVLLCGTVYAAPAADSTNWKKLYIDYINDNPPSEPEMSSYALIYINDDDIPELWINFGIAFEGNVLCTVSDGKLDVVSFSQYGLSYIERQNLFVLHVGRMDNFGDDVYRIQNGKFKRLHKGNYGAEDNANVQLDADGSPIYQYYWDGKEVSENEYERALSSVFDDSKAVDPDNNSYSASDIVSIIKSF